MPITPHPKYYYSIVNCHTGKLLSSQYQPYTMPVFLSSAAPDKHRWRFQLNDDSYYSIYNKKKHGTVEMVLDGDPASSALAESNGGSNQRWTIVSIASDVFQIQQKASNLLLYAANDGYGTNSVMLKAPNTDGSPDPASTHWMLELLK